MTFGVHVSGSAAEAVARVVPRLVGDLVASGVTAQDPALWGAGAERDAADGLGWVEPIDGARSVTAEVDGLRADWTERGIDRVVLCASGGAAAAASVVAGTAGVELTVLEGASPSEVRSALGEDPASTGLVVSAASSLAVQTEARIRAFERAFAEHGVDAAAHIVLVADPGSPLEGLARDAGYRFVPAPVDCGDPFSALTARALVPAGLAGASLDGLMREAESVGLELAVDDERNPALRLAAALVGATPARRVLLIVEDGTHIHGLGTWIARLLAATLGSASAPGRTSASPEAVPVVAGPLAPEATAGHDDVQIVRLVDDATAHHLLRADRHEGEILVSGSLGVQVMVWQYAAVIAARLLGTNPFAAPETAVDEAARSALQEERPADTEPLAPSAEDDTAVRIETAGAALGDPATLEAAIDAVIEAVPPAGVLDVRAFADRDGLDRLAGIRELAAARLGRPVVFDWAPGSAPIGDVVLQVVDASGPDLAALDAEIGFARLQRELARAEARLLAERGIPVLTLTLTDPSENLVPLFAAVDQ